MPKRRLTSRVPIWVRVSVVTTVILVGVLLGTMLLGAGDVGDRGRSGGGHGSGHEMERDDDGSRSDHGSGDDHNSDSGGGGGSGGDHGSGG